MLSTLRFILTLFLFFAILLPVTAGYGPVFDPAGANMGPMIDPAGAERGNSNGAKMGPMIDPHGAEMGPRTDPFKVHGYGPVFDPFGVLHGYGPIFGSFACRSPGGQEHFADPRQ